MTQATRQPTPSPNRHEDSTNTKFQQIQMRLIPALLYPRISKVAISLVCPITFRQLVVNSEKKLIVKTIASSMFVTAVKMPSILSNVCLSQVQSQTQSLPSFRLRMWSATCFTLSGSVTLTLTQPIGMSQCAGISANCLKVSKETPIQGLRTIQEQSRPILFQKTEVYLRGILFNELSQQMLTQNYCFEPQRMPNCQAVTLLIVLVMSPWGLQRQEQGSQGVCASVLTTLTFQQKKVFMRLGDTAQIRLSTNYIRLLSEMSTSLKPGFRQRHYLKYKLTQAQSSTPSIYGNILSQYFVSISPVTTIKLPLSLSSSIYIVCNWICMPTDTNTMKATDNEYNKAVLRLRRRCPAKFFRVSSMSFPDTQNKQRQATALSKRYCTLKESRIKPSISPYIMTKKMISKVPRSSLMRALGSKQYIINPNPPAMIPKINLAQGNYLPSIQVSTRIA